MIFSGVERSIIDQQIVLTNDNVFCLLIFWRFNATFSNISAISWLSVLVVEEAGENHRPCASNW
jgi:hypothetical protein